MAFRSVIAAASFAALAAAGPQLQPPPVALNAQIGQLHLPIDCTVYGIYDTTYDVVASGEAPAYAAPGAEYYVTDVAGKVTIPASVVNLARSYGGVSAVLNMTVGLTATNAEPASITAFQGYSIPITFTANETATIDFPGNNATIPKVGPFTIGSSLDPSVTYIGNTTVSLQLIKADGTAGLTVPVACTSNLQNVAFALTSVTVTDADIPGTYDPAPSNGYVPDFPEVPINHEFGFFKFPYACTFGPLGTYNIPLTLGGLLPLFLAPGEQFYLEQAESFLEVPASLVKLAKVGFPTVDNFFTTVSSFTLNFENTTPQSIDVAAAGALVSVTSVRDANVSLPLTIPIPPYFPLTVGPVAASSTGVGSAVTLAVGNATAYTYLRNSTNGHLFGFPVTCSPLFEGSLIAVGITDKTPANLTLGQPSS